MNLNYLNVVKCICIFGKQVAGDTIYHFTRKVTAE